MNRIAKESAEYGRRPYIKVISDFDEFHRAHFGVINQGVNIAESIRLKTYVITGIGNYKRELDSYKEKIIFKKEYPIYSISKLLPEEEAFFNIFEDILKNLVTYKFIEIIQGDESTYYFDSYGNKIIFPFRYIFNWDLLSEDEYIRLDLNVHASFKSDKYAEKIFDDERNFEIQIVRGIGLENENRVYKNFVVIVTYGLGKWENI